MRIVVTNFGGLVPKEQARTLPMDAAVLSYPLPRPFAEAHLTVIPPVRGVTPAVAQFSFTLRF